MQENRVQENRAAKESRSRTSRRGPLMVTMAVAVFGVLAMLIVDHGPWSRPRCKPPKSRLPGRPAKPRALPARR